MSQKNLWFESSGIMEPLERHYGVDRIRGVFEEIGYGKILFGSDLSTTSLEIPIAVMNRVVPAEQHQGVFCQNALQLGKRFAWWEKSIPAGRD